MKWRRRKTRGTLAGTVQLSNKACPRYYQGSNYRDGTTIDLGPGGDPPSSSSPCGCPPGRCWYDEQLRRRARVLLALTPEEWKRRLETEKADEAYSTLYNFIRGRE